MVGNSVWWLVDSGDKYGGCDKVESPNHVLSLADQKTAQIRIVSCLNSNHSKRKIALIAFRHILCY